ncbi:MAG: Gfo/Idh/MocA family oxidoreductase [Anaerolineae bacterium]|nr:Gfo/Idh/MocA family oxidoreductase [Anaerolineae bacterium]
MAKLRVAVVGAGLLGTRHARVFYEQPDAETVAVVDVNGARAESLASKVGARTYTDLEAALNDTAVDAVAIATPDHLHSAPVLTALDAGKHVFVEKPLATTREDTEAIASRAAAGSPIVMVNYSQRFVTDHAWLKGVIERGEIGQPQMVISVKFDTVYVPTGMLGWADQTSPIFFMSSHDLDLVHWFLGAEPTEVVAHEARGTLDKRGVAVHDGLNVLIQFAGGVSANFHSSWIHPSTYPRVADGTMQIIGSEGAVSYNMRTRTAELFNTRGGQTVEFSGPHTADEVGGKLTGAFTQSVRHFLDCVREGREPWTSPRRTLPTTLAQLAILDSLRLKQAVRVA